MPKCFKDFTPLEHLLTGLRHEPAIATELTAPPDTHLHFTAFKNSIFVQKWTLRYPSFKTTPLKEMAMTVEREEENDFDPYDAMVGQLAIDSLQIT